jgi:hypothetical protein
VSGYPVSTPRVASVEGRIKVSISPRYESNFFKYPKYPENYVIMSFYTILENGNFLEHSLFLVF